MSAMDLAAGSRWRLSTGSPRGRHAITWTQVGLDQPLFLIAGPCVVESEELQLRTAETLKRITDKLGIILIFKSSFDKANRSVGQEFPRARNGRGPARA